MLKKSIRELKFGGDLSPVHIRAWSILKENLGLYDSLHYNQLFVLVAPLVGFGVQPAFLQSDSFPNQVHDSYLEPILIVVELMEGPHVHQRFGRKVVSLESAFEFENAIMVVEEIGFAGNYNLH